MMRFTHFYVDRPRFAAVISILITLIGALAFFGLPVTLYPDIVPPTIRVTATYPGATPQVIAETVAAPIEQEVNGVEGMLYMTSSSTPDGLMTLTITFGLGVDLDAAQVLVQNRVAVAEPRLPEEVRRLGVVTRKAIVDPLLVVHLESPDNSLDQLYMSNYAILNIADVLARIAGVGSIQVFGGRRYSMRIWLDPERMAGLNLTASEVVESLQGQNVQVAGGTLGQPPMPFDSAFEITITSQGRLRTLDEFENIIVKRGEDGRLTRLSDIARVELGAESYVTESLLDGREAVGMAMFQRPGGNALATSREIRRTMVELSRDFPPGLVYRINYDPTEFIGAAIDAVYTTIFEASALVILVILLFLQNLRAAVIPILAIPVSLIGTFSVMAAFGFSLNILSLFGLVLSIGIVVDDAIVVVENIQRNLEQGMAPREASRATMTEVGTALVSIGLVLTSVFIPTAFLGGIAGAYFQQFALTIAVATAISVLNSLTLSPALGAILLKPADAEPGAVERVFEAVFGWLLRGFDRAFKSVRRGYGVAVHRVVRWPRASLAVFVLLLALTGIGFQVVPAGFIPVLDKGYLIVLVDLPRGSSLRRTKELGGRITDTALDIDGVAGVVVFGGWSAITGANAPHSGTVFLVLESFEERGRRLPDHVIAAEVHSALADVQDAQIIVARPPPVMGIGSGSDFKMMIQDRTGQGLEALEDATWTIADAANQSGRASRAFTTFSTGAPQYYLDIDRTRAEMLNVPVENVFETLEVFLGSRYVNDFTLFGRNYRVTAQADAPYRLETEDIERLRARNTDGGMVPLGSVVQIRNISGPDRVVRHNQFPAADLQFGTPPGGSTGMALDTMEQLARAALPPGFGFEWTELAYQQRSAGGLGLLVFPLAVLFVFLVLTAQYESWSLPFAIVLIVPLVLLFALTALGLRQMEVDILAQIGFVVLIGLACKNAILIVEFAKQQEDKGHDPVTAATEAAQLRLRPILMTSFAFIFGVAPLALASGAGAEMRQVLGTVVFGGMLGVTLVGLFLTPVFYVVIRSLLRPAGRDVEAPLPTQHSTDARS